MKATIFRCFDLFPVRPPQKFQVQAKITTMQPVLSDYLSVSYDYDNFTMKLPGKTIFKLKTKQNIFCERFYKVTLELGLIVIIL